MTFLHFLAIVTADTVHYYSMSQIFFSCIKQFSITWAQYVFMKKFMSHCSTLINHSHSVIMACTHSQQMRVKFMSFLYAEGLAVYVEAVFCECGS